VLDSVLRAYYASEKGEDAVIARATAIITQYQRRGNTLFGASNPAFPLAEENVATWGRQLVSHAPSSEAMAASYLTMVIHDLAKIKSIVSTLKAKYALTLQGTCNEWITAKLVEDVVAAGGSFGGVVGLQDIMGCDPVMRNAICSGFATGFSAAQLVQGESTVVDGLKVGQFLEANPAAGWYMDHFMLDTAGILGKPHKFTGTIIVDGHTFVPFSCAPPSPVSPCPRLPAHALSRATVHGGVAAPLARAWAKWFCDTICDTSQRICGAVDRGSLSGTGHDGRSRRLSQLPPRAGSQLGS
jgi:hypothetical protein